MLLGKNGKQGPCYSLAYERKISHREHTTTHLSIFPIIGQRPTSPRSPPQWGGVYSLQSHSEHSRPMVNWGSGLELGVGGATQFLANSIFHSKNHWDLHNTTMMLSVIAAFPLRSAPGLAQCGSCTCTWHICQYRFLSCECLDWCKCSWISWWLQLCVLPSNPSCTPTIHHTTFLQTLVGGWYHAHICQVYICPRHSTNPANKHAEHPPTAHTQPLTIKPYTFPDTISNPAIISVINPELDPPPYHIPRTRFTSDNLKQLVKLIAEKEPWNKPHGERKHEWEEILWKLLQRVYCLHASE